jgi:hypothetical protein
MSAVEEYREASRLHWDGDVNLTAEAALRRGDPAVDELEELAAHWKSLAEQEREERRSWERVAWRAARLWNESGHGEGAYFIDNVLHEIGAPQGCDAENGPELLIAALRAEPTEEEPVTVANIIAWWLREHHYDGLCSEDCGCGLDDLMPCGGSGGTSDQCMPAYAWSCSSCTEVEECDWAEEHDDGGCWRKTPQKEAP